MKAEKQFVDESYKRFERAVSLLFHEKLTARSFVEVAYELHKPFPKAPDGFWRYWPAKVTASPLYFRASHSALGLAIRFCDSVDSTILCEKVGTVGMPSDYFSLSEQSLELWKTATIKGLFRICSDMGGIQRFQEVDKIRVAIQLEWESWYRNWSRHEKKRKKIVGEQENVDAVQSGQNAPEAPVDNQYSLRAFLKGNGFDPTEEISTLDLMQYFGVKSRSAIRKKVTRGELPSPHRKQGKVSMFLIAEIEEIQARHRKIVDKG